MNWFYFAFGASLVLALSSVFEKKILKHEHAMEFSAAFALVVCILTWAVLGNQIEFPVEWQAWAIIYTTSWCGVLSFYFAAKVTRHLSLSTAAPVLALAPGLAILFSWLLLGEVFTWKGLVAVGIMLFGAFLIEGFKLRKHNFKRVYFSPLVVSAFFGVTAYALGTVFDKFVLSVFEVKPVPYLLLVQSFVVVNWILFLALIGRGIGVFRKGFALGGMGILCLAVLAIIHRYLYLIALSEANAGLVVAVKRSSVVWTTMAGYFLGEKSVFRKTVASVVILFGLVLLLFWK